MVSVGVGLHTEVCQNRRFHPLMHATNEPAMSDWSQGGFQTSEPYPAASERSARGGRWGSDGQRRWFFLSQPKSNILGHVHVRAQQEPQQSCLSSSFSPHPPAG